MNRSGLNKKEKRLKECKMGSNTVAAQRDDRFSLSSYLKVSDTTQLDISQSRVAEFHICSSISITNSVAFQLKCLLNFDYSSFI